MSSRQLIPLHFGRVTAIANDHARMEPMFAELRALGTSLRDGSGVDGAEFRSHLEKVFSTLARHFSAEESNSYFGVLMTERPSTCGVVAELCSEHAQMLAAMDDLRTRCEEQASPEDRRELAGRTHAFCDRFQAHEQKEAALMQKFLLDAE